MNNELHELHGLNGLNGLNELNELNHSGLFYASVTTSSLNTPNNCPITPMMAMISLDNWPVTKTGPFESAASKTSTGLGRLTICVQESAVLVRGLLGHFTILPVAIDASKQSVARMVNAGKYIAQRILELHR